MQIFYMHVFCHSISIMLSLLVLPFPLTACFPAVTLASSAAPPAVQTGQRVHVVWFFTVVYTLRQDTDEKPDLH